jgi:hypothetical protein
MAQDRVSLACDKAYQIRKLRYAEAPLIGLAAFQACPCLTWVKNGPDALEMGFLFYPREQTFPASVGIVSNVPRSGIGQQRLR